MNWAGRTERDDRKMITFKINKAYHSEGKVNVTLTPQKTSNQPFERVDGRELVLVGVDNAAAEQFVDGGECTADFKPA